MQLGGQEGELLSMKTITSFTGFCNLTDLVMPSSGAQRAGS